MNTIVNKISHRSGQQADKVMGYLGLFIIGALSQGAEVRHHTPLHKAGKASL